MLQKVTTRGASGVFGLLDEGKTPPAQIDDAQGNW